MPDTGLELRGLTKRYGSLTAVRDLSFDVRPGEVFRFSGSNGAGKTTTMRIVLGVLLADAGDVIWNGKPMDFETRRRIGYMREERGLYPKMPCSGSARGCRFSRRGAAAPDRSGVQRAAFALRYAPGATPNWRRKALVTETSES